MNTVKRPWQLLATIVAIAVLVASCGESAPVAQPTPHYLYVAGQHMWAINAADGKIQWTVTASATSAIATTPTMFVLGTLNGTLAINRTTGTQRWLANTGTVSQVFADGKQVYAIGTGLITALDAQTGKLIWHQTAQTGSSAALSADGTTLYTASGQALQAWNTATGATRWDHEQHGISDPYCTVMRLVNGLVICNSYGGHYAWKAIDGSVAWQLADPQIQDIDSNQQGTVLYGVGMPQALVPASAMVYAVDLTTGTVTWKHPYTDGTSAIAQPAVLSPDGQRVVIGQGPQGGDLASIDAVTGNEQWTHASLGMVGKLAANSTHLYVLYTDSLHAFTTTSGSEQWAQSIASAFQAQLFPDSTGIYLANNGQLTAYDPAGKVRWQQYIDSGPVQLLP